jgi:hypothetical protein
MVRQEFCWHETEMAWKDDARCFTSRHTLAQALAQTPVAGR